LIFVAVGTQKFEFNRLIEKVDELVESGDIEEEVFAQIGVCSYRPKHYEYKTFMPKDIMMGWMEKADIVITHAGTGMIMEALDMGKKVIAVPRKAEYGEHVDDHQFEIVRALSSKNIIEPAYDTDELAEAIRRVKVTEYKKYKSTRKQVVDQLDAWIREYLGA
jgi:UDP-N-acetylglucosamine transferase subunit ALG13